jgi:hypothetical protein
MVDPGWTSMGVLELTALPSIDLERWVPLVQEADALLVAGGDVLYLCHWMRQSGLADLIPPHESAHAGDHPSGNEIQSRACFSCSSAPTGTGMPEQP